MTTMIVITGAAASLFAVAFVCWALCAASGRLDDAEDAAAADDADWTPEALARLRAAVRELDWTTRSEW